MGYRQILRRQILRDLFGFGREPAGAEPGRPVVAVAAPASDRPEAEPPAAATKGERSRFDERLRALVERQQREDGGAAPLVAGRLQTIALADLMAKVGNRWPRLEAKVHGQIRRVLERRLTEADAYGELGGDGYMILFADLSEAAAAFEARAIAREITTRLVGGPPEGVEGVRIRAAVRGFAPGELGRTPDLDALAAAFDDGSAGRGTGGAPESPADAAEVDLVRFRVRNRKTCGILTQVEPPAWEAGMRPIRPDALGDEQLRELDHLYHTTRDLRARTRAQIVLLAAEQGLVAAQIAAIVRQNEETVRRWLVRYAAEGTAGLADAPRAGAPPKITPEYRERLLQVVRQRPRGLGLPFSLWTAARLADYLAETTELRLSPASVCRALRAGGMALSRPRHAITSPVPEYALKKTKPAKPAGAGAAQAR